MPVHERDTVKERKICRATCLEAQELAHVNFIRLIFS